MRQTVSIVLAAVLMFAVVAAIILHFMPEPIEESDYLVAGSVATLVALLILFLGLVSTRMKSSDVFVKKRKKQS
ncbi:MAG: hypothetical protein WDO18_16220 [Acidobacteriota bacterium]